MLHLTKIKATKKLNEEEEVNNLGQANKYERRTKKGNRNKGSLKAMDTPDDNITETSSQFPTSIKWIREEMPPTAMVQLDRAISTCKEMISLLQDMIKDEGDPDQEYEEEISTLRLQLRKLLKEKMNECLEDRSELKRKRNDN
jgi:hypothetical protein